LSQFKKVLKNLATKILNLKLPRDYSKDAFRYNFLKDKMSQIVSINSLYNRPQYVWGVLCAADLAKNLQIERISVIEFGVASGEGLRSLEAISKKVEDIIGIQIDVYGFDTGEGLPTIVDYRDLPNLWTQGYFPMDHKKLITQLDKAKLNIGLVKNTVKEFALTNPAPIGFIAFDLDLYSSTKDAFQLFDNSNNNLFLPRIHCYFDDIHGWTYSDWNGELLAISEFNQQNHSKKISKIYGLRYLINIHNSYWPDQIYLLHIFNHDLYNQNDGLLQTRFL
jgi:hypothetical protein